MGYSINLQELSIYKYRENLKTRYLVPSRRILKDNLDEFFNIIEKHGISNVEELLMHLKTKDKIEDFSNSTAIPIEYLTVLAREIKNYIRKPIKLKEFPGINTELVNRLEKQGIKNTVQLYSKVQTAEDRLELANLVGWEVDDIEILSKLCDLTRIKWVNHTFAYVLYEAGYTFIHSISNADYESLYNEIKQLNEKRNLYKGNIGLNDMRLLVECASDVIQEIEY